MSFEVPYNLPAEPVIDPASLSRKRKRKDKESSAQTNDVDVTKLLDKYNKLLSGAKKEAKTGLSDPLAADAPAKPKSKKQKKVEADAQSSAAPLPRKASRESTSKKPKTQSAPTNAQDVIMGGFAEDPSSISTPSLSEMQRQMKGRLGGARFRWINEQLYTTEGAEAAQMMADDPSIFEEYHNGFASQAATWPIQPLDLIISSLCGLPSSSVLVDLGCGEARLAQELSIKGYRCLSYDLVAPNSYVSVAQCTKVVPLPGDVQGRGSIADAVICCLSLMGKDWPGMIREAQRILKPEGQLKIAEVTSRFTNIDKFVQAIERAGFRFISRDETNTHFILFDFKRHGQPSKGAHSQDDGSLLKPCLYKKRG